jgi:hypothetical protein
MKLRAFSLIAVFAAFTIYSAIVVMNHGYTGFVELALAGGWGAQMFIDLVIALLLFTTWMISDARVRGIPAAPYVITILTLGSIGALAYLVHRTLKEGSPARRQAPYSAAAR